MRPFLALLRKQISRIAMDAGAFGRGPFRPGLAVRLGDVAQRGRDRRRLGDDSEQGRIRMLRMMGVDEQPTSISLIMASWSHPFIILLISIWAIGRGSAAVAAEVERGTMDLLLSRPISSLGLSRLGRDRECDGSGCSGGRA